MCRHFGFGKFRYAGRRKADISAVVLRKTEAGWRFIYYAEAPKSTMAYVQDMYQNMARPEFRERFRETGSSR